MGFFFLCKSEQSLNLANHTEDIYVYGVWLTGGNSFLNASSITVMVNERRVSTHHSAQWSSNIQLKGQDETHFWWHLTTQSSLTDIFFNIMSKVYPFSTKCLLIYWKSPLSVYVHCRFQVLTSHLWSSFMTFSMYALASWLN